MWSVFKYFVISFWLVMTILLVRVVYYPNGLSFVEMPPRVIVKMFLDQGASLNTLFIYHKDHKLGQATVTPRRMMQRPRKDDYVIRVSGMLEKGAIKNFPEQIMWWVEVQLDDLETWKGLSGNLRFPTSGITVDFTWADGDPLPKFVAKQRGNIIGDQEMLAPLLKGVMGAAGKGLLPEGMTLPEGGSMADAVKVKARESTLEIAGKSRKGYLLEFSMMDRWKAKAHFTEVGELALVTLPDSYRLVEPYIHNLLPDYSEEEPEEGEGENTTK